MNPSPNIDTTFFPLKYLINDFMTSQWALPRLAMNLLMVMACAMPALLVNMTYIKEPRAEAYDSLHLID